jgi:hypothetical protein
MTWHQSKQNDRIEGYVLKKDGKSYAYTRADAVSKFAGRFAGVTKRQQNGKEYLSVEGGFGKEIPWVVFERLMNSQNPKPTVSAPAVKPVQETNCDDLLKLIRKGIEDEMGCAFFTRLISLPNTPKGVYVFEVCERCKQKVRVILWNHFRQFKAKHNGREVVGVDNDNRGIILKIVAAVRNLISNE